MNYLLIALSLVISHSAFAGDFAPVCEPDAQRVPLDAEGQEVLDELQAAEFELLECSGNGCSSCIRKCIKRGGNLFNCRRYDCRKACGG